jgi:riboflavin synthase alpha subunit
MFTGLIESTGTIESAQPIDVDIDSGRVLSIATPMAAELTPGDSVSVNGVSDGHVEPQCGIHG